MRNFEHSVPGCGDLERSPHPCVAYRVCWPEITAAPSPEACRRVNDAIRAALAPAPPAAGWEEEARQLEVAYFEFKDSKFDNEAAFFHRRIAEVVRNSEAIFSVSLVEERFLGDDAPEFRQNYLNFNPYTGDLLRLRTLLAPSAEERLHRYTRDPAATPFAPAPEGLYLAPTPGLPPLLIRWSEAAAFFPARSPIVPLH